MGSRYTRNLNAIWAEVCYAELYPQSCSIIAGEISPFCLSACQSQ